MNKEEVLKELLDRLVEKYPLLSECRDSLDAAVKLTIGCYEKQGKLLICGNGGSASDASHIVGELMKGFLLSRSLPAELQRRLKETDPENGGMLAESLQQALPAISLCTHASLTSAVANDINPQLIFAQQVIGYGQPGDVLLGVSTSGRSKNVIQAFIVARAMGLHVIGLTGREGGAMNGLCDTVIRVSADSVTDIQELHLPVYHAYCAMLEAWFFGGY